ncbi:MAG: hypothetical protein IPO41_13145 [Acidobacteria bacterium]|nr:hypothetical protein [Acidobacteriota bacterium]
MEGATLLLAYDTALQGGTDLHFAFSGGKYVDSVERMIRSARSNQPNPAWSVLEPFGVSTFDDDLYRKTSKIGFLVVRAMGVFRTARRYRVELLAATARVISNKQTIFGLHNLKLQVLDMFPELDDEVLRRSLSTSKINNRSVTKYDEPRPQFYNLNQVTHR